MIRALLTAWIVLFVALPGGEVGAETTAPAVARPVLVAAEGAIGTVFFVAIPTSVGVAAIGTAHTIDRHALATAGEIEFRLGNSTQAVGRSRGFLVPPGTPFATVGANIRNDYFVYALEAAPPTTGPNAIRTLTLDAEPIERGARVRVLGIPAVGPERTSEVTGRVASASDEKIEVDLDRPMNLRGWGGAAVVSEHSGRVVGIVEAADPNRDVPRITAASIGGVREAIENRTSAETQLAFDRFAAPAPPASVTPDAGAKNTRAKKQPIILPLEPDPAQVQLTIEYPADGVVMTDTPCGAFVAGRAIALEGASRKFDVAIVLDTSNSTDDLTGADINGNGVIGTPHMGRMSSLFGKPTTDPGDTILAAEVAAARQLLRGLDPRTTRVSLITFSGGTPGGGRIDQQSMPAAITHSPLTSDFSNVEAALDAVLEAGAGGETDMAAGVRYGFAELNGLVGSRSEVRDGSTKLMFFFTDGEPTAPHGVAARTDNYLAVTREAHRAKLLGVRIHSFAIGPLALSRPIAAVSMADITDGYFTPVRHPGELSEIIDAVGFANLEDVTIQSVTTGDRATPFRIAPDGSWGGFVKLTPGTNQIEVAARASDGTQLLRQVSVVSESAAQPSPIPPQLTIRHNRLLEDCLRNAKSVRAAVEKEHTENVRRKLMLQIDEERARARKRSEQQRRSLDLEVAE